MNEAQDRPIKKFDLARLMKQTKMPLITVYNSPTDYPGQYIARVWDTNKPTRLVAIAETLEAVRESIPAEMCNIGRTPTDDPCIVEVWI